MSESAPFGYFTCASCDRRFPRTQEAQEAFEADKKLYPNVYAGLTIDDCAVVCDDCWKKHQSILEEADRE